MRKYHYATRHQLVSWTGFLAATLLLMSASIPGRAHPPSPEVVKMFPLDLGGFHQLQLSLNPPLTLAKAGFLQPEYFTTIDDANHVSPFIGGESEYLSPAGDKLLVEIVKFQSDSNAYSLFSLVTKRTREVEQSTVPIIGDVGIANNVGTRSIAFFRGTTFARVTNESKENAEPAIALARLLAATFDKGEDDFPVLVKHLPDWQTAHKTAIYAVRAAALREAISNQPILNELSFEGGTEAVLAGYGESQLLIAEFTTPQLAGDNDSRIAAKIQDLKAQGQSVPTAYRRVGNYSVFVFNAPDEKAANQLIDQVRYEKVVQWLGDDPHLFERLQRLYANMSANVLVAVLKSSGLSLLFCLGIGGLIGALLFRRRRALQRHAAVYSDAGGMVRLNLDDMTGTSDPRRLLEPGKHPESVQ